MKLESNVDVTYGNVIAKFGYNQINTCSSYENGMLKTCQISVSSASIQKHSKN